MKEISDSDFEFLVLHLEPIARRAGGHAANIHESNHARRMIMIAKKWKRRCKP